MFYGLSPFMLLGLAGMLFSPWKGVWRVLGAIPGAVLLGDCLKIVIGVALDPTSNNLWPFDIVVVLVLSAIYLALLGLLKAILTRGQKQSRAYRKQHADNNTPFSSLMSKARGERRAP